MCFRIKKSARRPSQRYVYKICDLRTWDRKEGCFGGSPRTGRGGYIASPFYPRGQTRDTYQPGAVLERDRTVDTACGDHVRSGIYVYLDEKVALLLCDEHHQVVVRLQVSPSDWLHSSRWARQATYDKAIVTHVQPHFDWEDEQ